MTELKIIKDSKTLLRTIQKYKLKKKKIGFVPTLGSLHKGHLELIRLAKKNSDIVVVSIFLNPLQFNSKIDFNKYPINPTADKKKICKEKVNILYTPTIKEIFPDNKIQRLKASKKAKKLCGRFRKGHFDGVVTVLKSLFKQVLPTIVFFGEKDFQQILIVKDLILKYKLKIKIIIAPTIRDSNGLAYSSRNFLLTKMERKKAGSIYMLIKNNKNKIIKNKLFLNVIKKKILKLGVNKIEYLKILDINKVIRPFKKKIKLKIFIAYYIRSVRLIDNI